MSSPAVQQSPNRLYLKSFSSTTPRNRRRTRNEKFIFCPRSVNGRFGFHRRRGGRNRRQTDAIRLSSHHALRCIRALDQVRRPISATSSAGERPHPLLHPTHSQSVRELGHVSSAKTKGCHYRRLDNELDHSVHNLVPPRQRPVLIPAPICSPRLDSETRSFGIAIAQSKNRSHRLAVSFN